MYSHDTNRVEQFRSSQLTFHGQRPGSISFDSLSTPSLHLQRTKPDTCSTPELLRPLAHHHPAMAKKARLRINKAHSSRSQQTKHTLQIHWQSKSPQHATSSILQSFCLLSSTSLALRRLKDLPITRSIDRSGIGYPSQTHLTFHVFVSELAPPTDNTHH